MSTELPYPPGHRKAVWDAALESGVPPELLITHTDLIRGLPDAFPYNEVVCLRDGINRKHADPAVVAHYWTWQAFLWRKHREQRDEARRPGIG